MNLLPVPRHARSRRPRPVDRVRARRVRVGSDRRCRAEGYALTIDRRRHVTIDAADAAGAFYARATLAQLARLHDGALPVGTVRDWPDLAGARR